MCVCVCVIKFNYIRRGLSYIFHYAEMSYIYLTGLIEYFSVIFGCREQQIMTSFSLLLCFKICSCFKCLNIFVLVLKHFIVLKYYLFQNMFFSCTNWENQMVCYLSRFFFVFKKKREDNTKLAANFSPNRLSLDLKEFLNLWYFIFVFLSLVKSKAWPAFVREE